MVEKELEVGFAFWVHLTGIIQNNWVTTSIILYPILTLVQLKQLGAVAWSGIESVCCLTLCITWDPIMIDSSH